jgi:UDP-glucose 4-epimerase
MARVVDLKDYYMIPPDNRDLNYAKYFSDGEESISQLDDYTSHNTERLNTDQVKELLLNLDYIKEELKSI